MPLRPLGLLRLPHRDRTPDKEDHSLLNVRAADVTLATCFFGLAAHWTIKKKPGVLAGLSVRQVGDELAAYLYAAARYS